MIALLFPMRKEAEPLLAAVKNRELISGPGKKYTVGVLEEREVGIFSCGIGAAAMEKWLAYILEVHRPQGLVIAGTAGALAPDLEVGEVILATSFHHPRRTEAIKPVIPAIITEAQAAVNLRTGGVLTVDQPLADHNARDRYFHRYQALVVEMEGFYAASFLERKDISWLLVRAVSDRADKNLLEDFRRDLPRVREKLASALCAIVRAWPEK